MGITNGYPRNIQASNRTGYYMKLNQPFTDLSIAKMLRQGFAEKKLMRTDASGVTLLFRKDSSEGCTCDFIFRKRDHEKRINVKLGRFPDMTIDDARAAWLDLKRKTQAGIALKPNIKIDKNKILSDYSFGKLWNEWRDFQSKNVAFSTEKKYISVWKSHLYKIEDMDVRQLTPTFILNFLKPIIDTGKMDSVRRIATCISGCLDFAVFKQMLTANPLLSISKFLPRHEVKHLASFSDTSLEADMIKLFQDFSDLSPRTQVLLHMYFYTLLRAVELRSLKISDIHDTYAVVKTKTRKEFKVTLSTQAMQCLRYMIANKQSNSDYVFEGQAGNSFVSENTLNKALNSKGYKDKLRVHGIRTCGRQWLQVLPDAKESIIELCLSHVVGNKVEQSYNRGEYLQERSEIMQKWCDFVEKCIGQNNSFMFK